MDYEGTINKRRKENRELLKTLGIFNLGQKHVAVKRPRSSQSPEKYMRKVSKSSKPTFKASDLIPTRKSNRLLGKEPQKFFEDIHFDDEEEDIDFPVKVKPKPKYQAPRGRKENVFGAIPVTYCCWLCYSLALSGGYEDDVDLGDSFIYTGEGGRDLRGTKTNPKNLRTAPQSKDQLLEKGNLALARNVESGLPVRVLRGYKLRSNYAPEEGYRYDGLYKVVKYYMTTGLSGFKVYKFHLERIKEQAPAPWAEDFIMTEESGNLGFCSDKENVPKDEDRLQNKKEKNSNCEPLSAEENITKENGQQRESSDSSAIHSPEEENASKEEQL
ncbi:E3 ubiquitin-protein ligase UHRF1 [Araneus ventricosus]|uniref:E3 ubiquitin-protein ligase UHRF1 n=1 Tax=Araneus ventricosus TaxID=182803 RepID=A0A4Y2G372_ARAVE|nr:E3 ubiquitin-protein ligase UHRF1 [Araneus ventricosus]